MKKKILWVIIAVVLVAAMAVAYFLVRPGGTLGPKDFTLVVVHKDGMEKRWLGRVALNGGVGEMTIEFGCDAAIDRISLLESDDYAPMQVVADGNDVSEGKLQILGHKNVQSMIHKFSGFTCAENYGFETVERHNVCIGTAAAFYCGEVKTKIAACMLYHLYKLVIFCYCEAYVVCCKFNVDLCSHLCTCGL